MVGGKRDPYAEAYARKPDPDEPWRYVCPKCKRQVNGLTNATGYRCPACEKEWPFGELWDTKERCKVKQRQREEYRDDD